MSETKRTYDKYSRVGTERLFSQAGYWQGEDREWEFLMGRDYINRPQVLEAPFLVDNHSPTLHSDWEAFWYDFFEIPKESRVLASHEDSDFDMDLEMDGRR